MKTWLLIDTNYLCHRARWTTGELSYKGVGIGVAFGVMRDAEGLIEQFGADRTVFAFDSRQSLRKSILPSYKSSRREGLTEEEHRENGLFYEQVRRLQNELLPMIGYRNIIECDGYEADDVIAKLAQTLPDGVDAIIVSADNDLLQCVGDHVFFHNPTTKKTVNLSSFIQEWGIPPEQWASVKALAGCSSDDVVGIKGIGEKTAAAFVNGKLKMGKKWHLVSENLDVMQKNLPLVKLPFEGIQELWTVEDQVTEAGKMAAQQKLGIRARRGANRLKDDLETINGFF